MPSSPRRSEFGPLLVAGAFFALSGAAALVYQIAWHRLLSLTTGVSVHSVAIITAAFMAGLGIGSHVGGVLSVRLSPRRALFAFAAIEAAIALFAVVSSPLYYGVLYRHGSALYANLGTATLTHFLSLLPPTALMGMSLPFLVRGLVRSRAGAARTIGILYAANALGAAIGAALTPWVLLRFLGIEGAVLAGAVGSLAAAVGAALLALRQRASDEQAPIPEERDSTEETAHPFGYWLVLYAISGMVSLSLEVVWFRILEVTAKGAAFTFGTLLAIYLTGLGLGTLAASGRAASIRRPLRAFLMCQGGIVLATLVAHIALTALPGEWPGVAWLVHYGKSPYGAQLRPFSVVDAFGPLDFVGIYVIVPLLLFGVSTFLMGYGFPILQRATQSDPRTSGRKVGLLQAANIAGCIVGSLLTGLVLLDTVGTSGVFRFLGIVACAVALFGARATRDRRFYFLASALALCTVLFPTSKGLWLRLHGDPAPAESLMQEDAAGVTVISPMPGGYKLYINGRHNSWLPYGWLHTVVGAIPALAHESPKQIAVIGLGSGDTAWATGCRPETESIRVFEIASSTPRLLAQLAELPGMERVHSFLHDRRVSIVKDDARRRLRAEGRKYDLIVADAIDYDSSMSNNVNSLEHYMLVRDHLNPGGMVCAVAKTPRIRAALAMALPYTMTFGREDLVLASNAPIPANRGLWIERVRSTYAIDHLGKSRMREIISFIEKASYGHAPAPDADVNRDLDPKDEFLRPER